MAHFVSFASTASSTFSGITGFFSSSLFLVMERLALIFVIALYGALVFWTAKDARRRVEDPVVVAVCIAASALFPFVGVLIYLILRPPEYLADVRERELEIRAMERRLGSDHVCPYCRNPAEASFLSCPHCGTKLKNACRRCKAPLDPTWRLCPYCESAVANAPPPPAPARRREYADQPTGTQL